MATERILIVDDDPAILTLCHRILEADGYTVVEAKRGEEAMAKLETYARASLADFTKTCFHVHTPTGPGAPVRGGARIAQDG